MSLQNSRHGKTTALAAIFVLSAVLVDRVVTSRTGQGLNTRAPRVDVAELDSLARYLSPVRESAGALQTIPVAPPIFAVPAPTRTAPRKAASRPAPRWNVSAILISEQRRAAVIDDAVVTVGESLSDGTRVSAIERSFVELTTRDGKRHLVGIAGGQGRGG